MNILSDGLSPKTILGRWLDSHYNPMPPLLEWLDSCGIVSPGSTFDGFVDAVQAKTQRYHDAEGKILKARNEIDLQAEDAQITREQTKRCFQALTNLGLFYHQFAPPPGRVNCMIWHGAYLLELMLQCETLVFNWRQGVRWDELVFAGAGKSVGTDLPVGELLRICACPQDYRQGLQNVNNQSSLYWYAPNAFLVEEIWKHWPMPRAMRRVPTQWIAAEDTVVEGKPRPANTLNALDAFAQAHVFDAGHHYGLCTRAPTALRQVLITEGFLTKHLPGAVAPKLSVISAPPVKPTSLFVANREAANVLWEFRKLRDLRRSA